MTPTPRKRLQFWIALAAIAAVAGWRIWSIRSDPRPAAPAETARSSEVAAAASATPPDAPAPSFPPPPARHGGPALEKKRAYRLVMTEGRIALEAVEDLHGDFHRRRTAPAEAPGMLRFRLLDDARRVLAEETSNAPDFVCLVLDPNAPGKAGQPKPARLTPEGPVVFQVRLPTIETARQLEIYRLTEPGSPGQLLATISLPE